MARRCRPRSFPCRSTRLCPRASSPTAACAFRSARASSRWSLRRAPRDLSTKPTRPSPDGPWKNGEEVWVFEAKNDYRVVTIEGVASIDPQQTTLPDAWKRFPAYPMPLGATIRFKETRRGDTDPPPDQLSLTRSLWLDFDGRGLTVQDVLAGTLNRESRLTMAPPTVLGRVAINGRDQFITTMNDKSRMGVEVRQGTLAVTADSRIDGNPRDIPAVGWAHDFHQVAGTLYVPPGWTLLHATGVDDVPGTWLRHWSLMQIFVALIIGIAIGRLVGIRWGAVALVMLVLILPEANAPEWCWIPLLAFEALVRVLPEGLLRRVFEWARLAAFLVVAVVAIPFAVQQVRKGLYPALQQSEVAVGGDEDNADRGLDGPKGWHEAQQQSEGNVGGDDNDARGGLMNAPMPAQKALERAPAAQSLSSPAKQGRASKGAIWQSNAQVYDPASVVQTGPGLPRWRWTALSLHWSGPVSASQRLHLYLVSPAANLVLALLRAALLLLLALRLFPYSARMFPRLFAHRPRRPFGTPPQAFGSPPAALLLLVGSVLLVSPRTARADVPDKATLDDSERACCDPPPAARPVRPAAGWPSSCTATRLPCA